ncbi:MAG TPA: type II toxin-antitoxin system VapC family toxin [Thermoanaerobaculia bacterium]|nr:type II toxin-antitoxin system VapC family toxin [Thermoanaerobaculia bacterium]
MSQVVVDTSVISYILKKHSLAPSYWEILKGHLLGISFMTVAELYCWPLQRDWGEQRIVGLRQHLRGYTVLPYSDEMSWEWARIKCRRGRPISDSDAWIAATALLHEAPLVTHNPRHFLHIEGLEVLTVSA